MVDIRLSQNVEAFYEAEDSFAELGRGTGQSGATLTHIGMLDTFDPRLLDHQYAGISQVGHSSDSHIVQGPTKVTVPLKFGLWGTGWQGILGRAIGKIQIDPDSSSTQAPAFLSDTVDSFALVADERITSTTWQSTFITGVGINEAKLELDYTTAAPIMLDCDCWAFYTQDKAAAARTTARNFNAGFLQEDYSGVVLPSQPATDPLQADDVTITYSTAAATNNISIDGPAGSWVEIGERYMRFFLTTGAADDNVDSEGIIDLAAGANDTLTELAGVINGDTGWTCSAPAGGSTSSAHLLKGVYDTGTTRTIYAATTMTDWPYVKTATLTIANNLVAIPQKKTQNSTTKWLQHALLARSKTDITLDITATAKDETFYDQMVLDGVLPLVRLDFGSGGSIALTNGKIMTRSASYGAGAEVTETLTVKFTGEGDKHNWSKYAISADWAL